MKVTFVEASHGRTLSKTIGATETTAYPNVVQVTSHEYDIEVSLDGLRQKYDLLQEHSAKGHCLLKGHFTRKLNSESRAGACDKQALTSSLIMDLDNLIIDGLAIPKAIDRVRLTQLTERFIEALPAEFSNVSYILQASSSMGLKKGLNVHIEFFLAQAVSPKYLKNLLTKLNFELPLLEANVSLGATGTSLKYVLDPSVADNSKLIYIAPPQFKGIPDPFTDPGQRIEFVEKERALLDISSLYPDLSIEQINEAKKKMVKKLRSRQGLPAKTAASSSIRFNDKLLDVVTNPDKSHLRYLRDNETFIHFDLDRPGRDPGDSGAYYVYKSNPNVVFNFKGDPPFLFQEADPDTYAQILQQFPPTDGKGTLTPFVFRDMTTDRIFSGFYNQKDGTLDRIDRISAQNVTNFFQDFGCVAPAVIPQMDMAYVPPDPEGFRPDLRKVNQYIMSDIMRTKQTNLVGDAKLAFGSAADDLKPYCPTIYKIMFHVLGSDSEAFERFINWFAFIVQRRTRAETAWILHGTQGTGKGILFNKILAPVLGRDNCSSKDLSNMEDAFTGWVTSKMLVNIDEFRLSNAKNADALEQKIKRLITDESATVRAMYTDQADARTFVNLILTSNYLDVATIPEGDRRMNVAPRQEQKLLEVHEEFRTLDIEPIIEKELPYFAEYVKNTKLDVRMVREAWDNPAKAKMQTTTKNTVDEFIEAFSKGDLDYFVPLLEEKPIGIAEMEIKSIVDGYLRQCIKHVGKRMGFRAQELAIIYNYMHGAKMTPRKFAKMCQHHNLFLSAAQTISVEDGLQKRAKVFITEFKEGEFSQEELAQAYLVKTPVRPAVTIN